MLGLATNANGERIIVTNGFSGWLGTPHATAVNSLIDSNGVLQPTRYGTECIACHSVGWKQPGGFTDLTNTPHLASVGCEACHGPAGQHVNVSGRNYHPVNSMAAETCGGCHTGSHHPTHDEWTNALHSVVDEHVAEYFELAGTSGTDRQMSCGACHSAATRMAMLKNWRDQQRGYSHELSLPSGHDAAAFGITCAVCHDPHSMEHEAQVRHPLRSTNFFTMFTTAVSSNYVWTNVFGQAQTNKVYYNNGFNSQYDPNLQICAQCHNSRGARWDGRSLVWNGSNMVMGTSQSHSRPPHHSPQYNMLIGILQPDYLHTNSMGVATNYLQRHGTSRSGSSGAYNTNQCVTCHMVSFTVDAQTHVTGHSFEMNTQGCTISGCHGSVPSIEEAQHTTTNSITRVISLLAQWGTTKGAALGLTKGVNNWEYTTTGTLAPVNPDTANAGPSTAQQALIPDAIKQARFNTYMVLHDGSLGVHNPRYANFLLSDAENKVLSQFTLANFKATNSSTAGFAPFTVGFTNLGTGVTGYSWNFGDGNTSTDAAPTNIYTTPGVYTVTLTATDGVRNETVTRTNMITVVQRPVVNFDGTPRSGTAPLTVNFTNTSTSTNNVTAWRWTVMTGVNITATETSFTYTNAGTYNVSLRATTAAGNVTATTNAYITVTAP